MPDRAAKICYNRGRREWLAVIHRDTPDGVVHVLTVGCEDTRAAAEQWAHDTLKLMDAQDSDEVQLPDKYDRAKLKENN